MYYSGLAWARSALNISCFYKDPIVPQLIPKAFSPFQLLDHVVLVHCSARPSVRLTFLANRLPGRNPILHAPLASSQTLFLRWTTSQPIPRAVRSRMHLSCITLL